MHHCALPLVPRLYGPLLLLAVACSEAPSDRGPDLGGPLTSSDSSGSPAPTSAPGGSGGSGEQPTTESPTETTTGTTSGTTTDGDTSTTDGPTSACGNDEIDPGEQCDDGAANDDNAFCTSTCQLNFCGDGNVLIGWELCDDGAANSDIYGSTCSAMCAPAPRCGDHIVQDEAGEECDLGPDNGGSKGDEQGILCEASCRSKSLRAFVTSQAFSGALAGLYGADKKCRDAAEAAGLPEPYRFHAYLSTPDLSANDRFQGALSDPLPYVLVTGKKLADSHAKLLAEGPLAEGLSVTELGTTMYDKYVATNTTSGGDSYSPDQHCQAWTSADPLLGARAGLTFPSDPADVPAWLQNGRWVSALTYKCDKAVYHLYCFEI